jgi:hypothetical protein
VSKTDQLDFEQDTADLLDIAGRVAPAPVDARAPATAPVLDAGIGLDIAVIEE